MPSVSEIMTPDVLGLDPTRGVAGLFLTQVRPFCDPRVMAAYAAFEQAVYAGSRH
jgi:hypothetical protein